MTTKSQPDLCGICKHIPQSAGKEARVDILNKGWLTQLKGSGRYYRGEEGQLSTFTLLQCPECDTYYEDAHHYYSDPQSTMGLARDRSDWYVLSRLNQERAAERRRQLK